MLECLFPYWLTGGTCSYQPPCLVKHTYAWYSELRYKAAFYNQVFIGTESNVLSPLFTELVVQKGKLCLTVVQFQISIRTIAKILFVLLTASYFLAGPDNSLHLKVCEQSILLLYLLHYSKPSKL